MTFLKALGVGIGTAAAIVGTVAAITWLAINTNPYIVLGVFLGGGLVFIFTWAFYGEFDD